MIASEAMDCGVAVTGIGLVSPLGSSAGLVLERIRAGRCAFSAASFDHDGFACPLCAPVTGFDAREYFPADKELRLMNRDAQLAVAAARLACLDAGVSAGETYPAERMAIFGATGMSGLPLEDAAALMDNSCTPQGTLDLGRLGAVALRRVRPVLSFKILSNMPVCFVSIFQNVRGENAVYAPWEGQGAQAIAAGIGAVAAGRASCALVGGCDVRTHMLSFVTLQQLGAFDSWAQHGRGTVPGEGAAFLVLEDAEAAVSRGARIHARIRSFALGSLGGHTGAAEALAGLLSGMNVEGVSAVVAAGDDDARLGQAERCALERLGLAGRAVIQPKRHLGNLYAASAAVQTALAAALAAEGNAPGGVLANCFGMGSELGAFVLEAP